MASDEDETRLTKSSRERRRRLRRERQQAEKARGRDTRSDDDDSVSCSAGTGTGTNMESYEKLKNKLRYLILNDIGSINISRTKKVILYIAISLIYNQIFNPRLRISLPSYVSQ